MDHLQLRQDQQTLILREIQQHLGLLPPTPPVSPMPSEPFAPADDFDPADDATPIVVPSIVAAEDPSYPLEEPTTWSYDHSSPFFVSIFYVFGCDIYFEPLLYWDWMYSMFILYIVLS